MHTRRIDLHTHSSASDGTDSPAALARKAAACGLAAFALTDHDSTDGLAEAGAEAARLGLKFVPGVEIAVRRGERELHILGLFLPMFSAAPEKSGLNGSAEPLKGISSSALEQSLAGIRARRDTRNRAVLDRLAALGMPLDPEDVRRRAGGKAVGRPHMAAALAAAGYVADGREAFIRFLGRGCPAYVPRNLSSPEEGIALLRRESPVVSLAHPFLSPTMTGSELDDILAEFRPLGLTALEAWHSDHGPEQTGICLESARKHGLAVTGGSDYHGENKKNIALGTGRGNLSVPLSLLEDLERRFFSEEVPLRHTPAAGRPGLPQDR
ncbi:MAG: PHP domain-containing protein [Desulfovibrio sp.]|jgi:predicted metal-dependent phosphoesterase TrpH|nr:PHP domain-containing protein [Desulfovibrio sp.]